jgi:transcriptional regulator with XRE-family HTH domain
LDFFQIIFLIMATGKEIKRLRGSLSAAAAAEMIGVDVERLRKWEQRDADPKDSADIIAVENYFGVSLDKLSKLDNFQFVPKGANSGNRQDSDFQAKYLKLMEEKVAYLEKRVGDLEGKVFPQLTEVVQTLAVIRKDMEVMAALQQGYQNYWATHYPPQGATPQQARSGVRKETAKALEKIQKDGIHL